MMQQTRRLFRFHIFVSYQSNDSQSAITLTQTLQQHGLRVWLDRDSGEHARDPRSPGDTRGKAIQGGVLAIRSAIEAAAASSILLTVITSQETLASAWVRTEIQIARSIRLPLFFWHISDSKNLERVSVRKSGQPWDGTKETLEADQYAEEHLAPAAASDLMGELSNQSDLNIVGQTISPAGDIPAICGQLNHLVELSELVIHEGETVHFRSLEQHWPQYAKLRAEAREAQETILKRFGKPAPVYRLPLSNAFRLKRPFVKQRVVHLERILNNDSFRRQQLGSD